MHTNNMRSPISPRASRLKLLFVIFLFLGPLLGAFIWYYGFGAAHAPRGQSNHSPLMQPAYALAPFSNRTIDGEMIDNTVFERKWTVLHVLNQQCRERCESALYTTRQTRIAVGRDAARIQRLIIVADRDLAARLKAEHADAKFLMPAAGGLEQALEPVRKTHPLENHDAVFIDPLGNAMMLIPSGIEPRLLLKDFKKLLKISRIG